MSKSLYTISNDKLALVNDQVRYCGVALDDGRGMASETDLEAKSADERRIERLTWFGLVGVLVVAGALPSWLRFHNGITPAAAGLILLIAGFMQYRRGFRVGYTTWLAGTLLLALAGFNFFSRPALDLSLVVIVIVIAIVGAGVFTRET